MTTNLLTQFNYNKSRPILSMADYYHAFKANVETKADAFPGNQIIVTGDSLPYTVVGDIGIMNFSGFTVSSATPMEEIYYGVISLQDFCEDLQMAVEDEAVNKVVINFDSGGGYTGYLAETSELIQELVKSKPIFAYTSGYLCSAAYAVACNCSSIVASPSALVGSIGCYVEYFDYSQAMAQAGIVVNTFQGGANKTVGSPYIPLTDEQKAVIQSEIDTQWNQFKALVKSNRGPVDEQFMQGDVYTGLEALQLNTNLIDGNMNSLKQFVQLIYQS